MLKVKHLGSTALLVEFRQNIDLKINKKVYYLDHLIQSKNLEGIIYTIPAFCSLTVGYDPGKISYFVLSEFIKALAKENLDEDKNFNIDGNTHIIPVCYDERFATDIEVVMKQTGLGSKEIIELHISKEYTVLMTGFLPGFVYLGKVPSRLHCRRKLSPELKVAAGSVGLAGSQTGIYPFESPGGWQIIGRTPVKTLELSEGNNFLFKGGDKVKFKPISFESFEQMKIANR
ncbi:5-oxoprolinase subunit PxpB [Mangrovivirga sp. M17]|uniref:5-oxoprolinase subunit PxpB n=1 Tax=Mangrovivirga halotolerans TaxID=2993936 RepID=A0ABT3RWH8_9BACT|nr:5-oxoprolinase subunit PxpB [Mangrovivirga halotolerans]MCX2745881.1 5-oxoprolinase subunit PxpB [Mangrovivirga halotolerans]